MPDPHEQHSPSGFDPFGPGPGETPGAAPGHGQTPGAVPGAGDQAESGDANRFWQQYSSARGARGPRNGRTQGEGPAAEPEAESRHEHGEHECLDWCPICRGAEVVRATTPPELRDQWASLQRDALVMMRALIDSYLQRVGEPPPRDRERPVEDIRID